MEKYNYIEISYYIMIFSILFIDINNYKLAKNYIDKFYISYIYYTKEKWKYIYRYYIRNIMLLFITYYYYHYISLIILIVTFNDIIIETTIVRKIMNNIKLKETRNKIKSPLDIINMIHINNMFFNIEDIKLKYEKGKLNNNWITLYYLLLFALIIFENISVKQLIGG